jgi:hypothetical protein
LTGILLIVCGTLTESSCAHKPSDSYVKIRPAGQHLAIQWDISLKDLDFQIGLDADQNGEITWGEVKNRRSAIEASALSHLRIEADGIETQLSPDDLLIANHSDGAYAALMISTGALADAKELKVEYRLFFDVDPTHRGLVLFQNDVATSTYVLSPDEPTAEIKTADTNATHALLEFVREGIWHIWIGFDHILFLISLLLPAVFLRKEKQWEPVETFWPACKAVLKIVTLFTVAHSITLWLSVMEYVKLPSGFVEATIAFSIIVTAVLNLYPVIKLPTWVIAFGFGLIHGFGFANVLVDLGLSSMTLAISLLGFNVGVEIGQIAIVLVFLPLAFWIRHTWFYRYIVFVGGSILIAIIAVIWFAERVGNFEILGF